ncbi:MAG: OmpH family outer membrane protein [Bacteroidetes bacterium]|nr:OmpH family outer membrane protein [Bacteroidota bacterium]
MKMKQVFFLFCLITVSLVQAQRSQVIGFVDSDVILAKMPEYRAAQKDLDDIGAKFQAEAQKMQTVFEQMQRDFVAEEILLTLDQIRQKKETLGKKEAEVMSFREEKFGPLGALYSERSRLIKPLQDKVYEAIQSVAKKEGYAFIFDKSGGALMLYADQKFDKTLEVMEALGISTEDMPNAIPSPVKPNTQNRGQSTNPLLVPPPSNENDN